MQGSLELLKLTKLEGTTLVEPCRFSYTVKNKTFLTVFKNGTKMKKIYTLIPLLFLTGCFGEDSSLKEKLEKVGNTVLENKEPVKDTLTEVGTTVIEIKDRTKENLAQTGEIVIQGGSVAKETLEAVGQTVIDITQPAASAPSAPQQ